MSDELKSLEDHAANESHASSSGAASGMGREVTIGLAALASLLGILSALVYVKLGAPGFPGGANTEVAAASEETPAVDVSMPEPGHVDAGGAEHATSGPIQVPAQDAPASTPFDAVGDRYSQRSELATPPVEAPAVGGMPNYEHEPSAAATPFDTAGAPPAAADQIPAAADAIPPAAESPFPVTPTAAEVPMPEADIPPTAATFPDLPSQELPADAPSGGPLMLEAEHAAGSASEEEAADVRPAAGHEPPLAEPHNAPYGRAPGQSGAAPRYGAPRELPGEEGPRAAPSAEHTPLHNAPGRQWNAPRTPAADGPHESELERELQESRTPHYQNGAPPPAGRLNDLDAPASEFAPPSEDMARHQHLPTHTPTPDGTYTVAPNDSFWTISQKVYGTPGYFKAVQRHNRKPGGNADGLEIGEKVLVPPAEVLEQKYPQLCPKRRAVAEPGRAHPTSSHGVPGGSTYVVQDGDTLFDIARYELGKASRWAEIYDLNRHQLGDDYNYIAPGTRLVLPAEAPQENDAITSRPGARTR